MSHQILTSLSRPLTRQTLSSSLGRTIRHASTDPSQKSRTSRRYLSTTVLLASGALGLAYYYDSRSLVHEHVVMPIVRMIGDAEQGHKLAVRVLSWDKWARPRDMATDAPELQAELFGHKLINPVGLAAGFDKDADAIDGLFDLGFGYVEVGSVTPEPQPGNPKPRFFRLMEDDAAINRYGFNSQGHGYTLARLRSRLIAFSQAHPSLFPSPLSPNPLPPAGLPRSLRPGQILAVNLGKNKTSAADSNEDYIRGVRTLGPYADVVVINVSSPNTPGLRALQGRQVLEKLLTDVVEERDRIAAGTGLPKIAVKVASDLSEEELADVASAVRSSGVEGVIVSNTTIRREGLGLISEHQGETGGLSGRPLFPYALQAVKTLRPLLPPSIPLIGCGGVTTGSDALSMAQAGASIVQIYTTFGLRGVGTPALLKDDITRTLAGVGGSWKSEIGKDWRSSGLIMGWDERRLQQESEAVKKEAEGLGELLRHLDDKEDLARLVHEVQSVLSQGKEETATQASATASGTGAETSGDGPRDNLLGSQPVREQDTAQGLVEGIIQGQATGIPLTNQDRLIQLPNPNPTPVAGTENAIPIGAPSIGEALLSDPVAIDLTPIVVANPPPSGASPPVVDSAVGDRSIDRENEWSQSVKSGQRRLV